MTPDLANGAVWYGAFLVSAVCHETAHARAALRLGDDTAQRAGQTSLNPWPHMRREPVGMVLVPLLSWAAGGSVLGWASAPYSPAWARQHPRRAGLMAVAGPAANLGLAAAAALLIRLGLEWRAFTPPFFPEPARLAGGEGGWAAAALVLSVMLSLNLLLFCFNLLPIPPLDGSSLPLLLLPARASERYFDAVRSPWIRMAGLVLIFRGLGPGFGALLRPVCGLLYAGLGSA